ncbi:MAG: helix-turn-helix domain-containing protein [Chloroflexi bacterium AL-W]|nr:helix-turn-helix domain-containing protein [Chloroflexi bacterium AL-N1]NOK68766.1 helix-turn-helix domain-containing protein [Chloroflexi bacterium AL-N10]NOK76252.1 helix-turn-helix domain-containing protein [Chloroflexi bacterium AL-N5]NOK84111.1 helix-turn-helix domain-containing protein [Chloroflexi bacterium AL-W]NOK91390.1 helix-turn-helix domain-containing protein [Chloroflexi bacterium AL-N15]
MTYWIDGEEYLDVEEATGLLDVKRATLYTYVSRGLLRSYRQNVGRRRLYRREDVEALRAVRPSDAPVPPPVDTSDGVMRDVNLPHVESWAGDH